MNYCTGTSERCNTVMLVSQENMRPSPMMSSQHFLICGSPPFFPVLLILRTLNHITLYLCLPDQSTTSSLECGSLCPFCLIPSLRLAGLLAKMVFHPTLSGGFYPSLPVLDPPRGSCGFKVKPLWVTQLHKVLNLTIHPLLFKPFEFVSRIKEKNIWAPLTLTLAPKAM